MVDKITVGNVEIVAVIDMIPPPRATSDFFPDVPEEAWDPYRDEVLENGLVQLYYGCFFARSQGKIVLIDTGMGPGPHVTRDNRRGDLLNQLRKQGVQPDEVDIVAHSHLHPDHVGWNLDLTTPTPTPNFPNATYIVPRLDWQHFTQPDVLETAQHVKENVVPLEALNVMELVDSEYNVTDEITTLATPGHTPGHQIHLISSQGEKAMIIGDAIHSKVQIQEPSWCAGVDIDKDDSRRSREDLLKRAEEENYVVAAGHFHPEQHIGRIVRLEGRRYWQVI